jgi:hypothetical protein
MSVRERIVIFFWYIAILCWAALICASIALVPALGGRGWVEAWGVIVVLIFLANFFALAVSVSREKPRYPIDGCSFVAFSLRRSGPLCGAYNY